ncbi:MAG: formimidoylglutamase [Promethearchaeota archaeon]
MKLKNYKLTDPGFWQGRIDDPNDPDSYRMHQIIKLLDLNNLETLKVNTSRLNICFLGYCCDEGIKRNLGRPGAKHGPEDIRKEFANLPVSFGDQAIIYDAGDIFCYENEMEESQKQLGVAVEIMLGNNMFPLVLGGGHELAYGHFNGIINYLQKQTKGSPQIGIINFDAHFDLRPYESKGSSGTMFSQIADKCSNENIEFNYLCLGIQTSANTKSLFKKADSLGGKYILAKEFIEFNKEKISTKIKDFINENEFIYLTLCSDVFNSAFAPGVSSLQPFGLNPEFVLTIIKEIIKSKKVISFDIAEVSPRFDHDKRTAKLASIIIYALINSLTGIKD